MTPPVASDVHPDREQDVDIVIPTIGRPSLGRLLGSLSDSDGPRPRRVLLVDDRPGRVRRPLPTGSTAPWLTARLEVIDGRALGPAAARNDGWRRASASWIAFLDDDVEVPSRWLGDLSDDLTDAGPGVGGSQGRIVVPRRAGRRPTDWERNVSGLEQARWATADLAYRRSVLAAVHGFDERFPRAYREDADLGLRVTAAGWTIRDGRRHVLHPVPPSRWWISIVKQAGNADDALMDRLHGPGWQDRAGAPAGRRPLHLLTTAALVAAVAARVKGRRGAAAVGGVAWLTITVEFAGRRLRPGPRSPREVATVVCTSLLVPPAATAWWLGGVRRARRLAPAGPPAKPLAAVLLDRDGTLVVDVPYNGDPGAVEPVPGAAVALDRLRRAGFPLGIVTNQSGVARGLLAPQQVVAVNRRVEELLGPFDVVAWCPHGEDDRCTCRKPGPGLVEQASTLLGVDPREVVVIGDIGADVIAATAAGARGLLVPTPATRIEEVERCPHVFADLGAAVDHLLSTGTAS